MLRQNPRPWATLAAAVYLTVAIFLYRESMETCNTLTAFTSGFFFSCGALNLANAFLSRSID